METSKTLKLKKPLNPIQQARLAHALHSPLGKDISKKSITDNENSRGNKNYKDNKNNINKEKNKNSQQEVSKDRTETVTVGNRGHSDVQKKKMMEAVEWLSITYPQCFSQNSPKPLCVGIFNMLLLKEEWPYSKTRLRRTLGFYTRSPLYRKAVLQSEVRYFLSGEVAEEISENEKTHAREELRAWEEFKKMKNRQNTQPQKNKSS